MRVFGVDDNGKYGERPTCPQNTTDGIRHQQITDTATTHPLVPGQSPDQCGRKILKGERKGTQAVEADDTECLIRSNEHPRQITTLVLARAPTKPIIEFDLPACETGLIVVFAERLDDKARAFSP